MENTAKKQKMSMITDHEPIVCDFVGSGLRLVLSSLKMSLLVSIRMKRKMQVAPRVKTEANIVI